MEECDFIEYQEVQEEQQQSYEVFQSTKDLELSFFNKSIELVPDNQQYPQSAESIPTETNNIQIIGDSVSTQPDVAINTLRKFEILNEIGDAKLKSLSTYFNEIHATRGYFVYKQSHPIDGVYFLINGRVQFLVSQAMSQYKFVQTKQIVIGELNECKILGLEEIILKGKSQRSCSIKVISDTAYLLFMSTKNFKDKILNSIETAKPILMTQLQLEKDFHHQLKEDFIQFYTNNEQPIITEKIQEIKYSTQANKVKDQLERPLPPTIETYPSQKQQAFTTKIQQIDQIIDKEIESFDSSNLEKLLLDLKERNCINHNYRLDKNHVPMKDLSSASMRGRLNERQIIIKNSQKYHNQKNSLDSLFSSIQNVIQKKHQEKKVISEREDKINQKPTPKSHQKPFKIQDKNSKSMAEIVVSSTNQTPAELQTDFNSEFVTPINQQEQPQQSSMLQECKSTINQLKILFNFKAVTKKKNQWISPLMKRSMSMLTTIHSRMETQKNFSSLPRLAHKQLQPHIEVAKVQTKGFPLPKPHKGNRRHIKKQKNSEVAYDSTRIIDRPISELQKLQLRAEVSTGSTCDFSPQRSALKNNQFYLLSDDRATKISQQTSSSKNNNYFKQFN